MSEPRDLSNVPLRTSDPETGRGYIACPHDQGVCHHDCDTAFGPCWRKENGMSLSDVSRIVPCLHCSHPLNMHAQGGGYCSACACKGFSRPSELGPDAPTITNAAGGKQSDLHYRFDLMDPDALFALAGILDHGERKYGEGNWRKISVESHLNHALVHIYAWLAGNTEDDHLGHAFCRLMMAKAVSMSVGKDAGKEDRTWLLERALQDFIAFGDDWNTVVKPYRGPELREAWENVGRQAKRALKGEE